MLNEMLANAQSQHAQHVAGCKNGDVRDSVLDRASLTTHKLSSNIHQPAVLEKRNSEHEHCKHDQCRSDNC
jgi:hypothetical protein